MVWRRLLFSLAPDDLFSFLKRKNKSEARLVRPH